MTRRKILLVDDEPITGLALTVWLERCGHAPTYAEGPKAADELLARESFDLILSDVLMPGNGGLVWIERLLEIECPPPVLLMTGSPELESAMRAANLPIAGYLLKPINFARTERLIAQLTDDYARRRDLIAVSRELCALLAGSTGPDAPTPALAQELGRLAKALHAEGKRSPRELAGRSQDRAVFQDAITDAIAVLERTKHSFRSKELGELRQRLLRLVPPAPRAPRSTAAR